MDKEIINDFLKGFNENYYPEDFLNKYEPVECLAQNQMGETLHVRDSLNTDYIAKCYTDASLLSQVTESVLLKKLHHRGLPELVGEFKNNNMLCVVRQFAQGIPLNQLEEPLSETQIINIGIQLCEILDYLHGQKPPIIHRDIKPQNIVIDESGKVTLIDFGISREYDESARADTVFFGTQEFAPPEQYGFSQTDNRTDIFSLGVVLAWLLTGRTSLKSFRIKNRRLEHIVRKCTAFAPKDRYRNAEQVRKVLQNADGHKEKKALRVLGTVLALFAMLMAGFAVGRFTDIRPPVFYNNAYAYFSEPLVEQAVRLQLGKADGEPIRAEELDNVKELYIYAGHTVKSQAELNELRGKIDRGEIEAGEGTIYDLNELARLKNLQQLSLGYQGFTDMSAIAQFSSLQSLELYFCPITDIESIRQLPMLRHFALTQCDAVTDISPLADCPRISELILVSCLTDDFSPLASLGDIEYLHMINMDTEEYLPYLSGKTISQFKIAASSLASLDELAGIDDLENLELDGVEIKSLSGIENLTNLNNVGVWNMPQIDLTPLTALPKLETVTLTEDMRDAAQMLGGSDIEIIYQ